MPVISTTGGAELPDVGTLSYNGVTFSCLWKTNQSGRTIQDDAGRTVKWLQWTLHAEGLVTYEPTGDEDSLDGTMDYIRTQLTQDAGILTYQAKGFGEFVINKPGGQLFDLNWGPKTTLLKFTPLGNSQAAAVVWEVDVCISEQAIASSDSQFGPIMTTGQIIPVVQFTTELAISYDEEGYSSINIRGTLEIGLTRPSPGSRNIVATVDDFRSNYIGTLMENTIDLTRFRVTHREFPISRDRRTMNFSITAEELPPQALPPGVMTAHGTFSFRQLQQQPGNVQWLCTLRATYTVAKPLPRRVAFLAFVSLWVAKMNSRVFAVPPAIGNNGAKNQQPGKVAQQDNLVAGVVGPFLASLLKDSQKELILKQINDQPAMVLNFEGEEGLYLDSKTSSFSATWKVLCSRDRILLASGLWVKSGAEDPNVWAAEMASVQGWSSWLVNRFDVNGDVIVDFGGN